MLLRRARARFAVKPRFAKVRDCLEVEAYASDVLLVRLDREDKLSEPQPFLLVDPVQ